MSTNKKVALNENQTRNFLCLEVTIVTNMQTDLNKHCGQELYERETWKMTMITMNV